MKEPGFSSSLTVQTKAQRTNAICSCRPDAAAVDFRPPVSASSMHNYAANSTAASLEARIIIEYCIILCHMNCQTANSP